MINQNTWVSLGVCLCVNKYVILPARCMHDHKDLKSFLDVACLQQGLAYPVIHYAIVAIVGNYFITTQCNWSVDKMYVFLQPTMKNVARPQFMAGWMWQRKRSSNRRDKN